MRNRTVLSRQPRQRRHAANRHRGFIPEAYPLEARTLLATLFGDPQTFDTGRYPVSIDVADVNNDSHLDLLTVNQDSTNNHQGNTVSVLLGRGDGTFSPGVDTPAGSDPISLAVGDLNRDGKADVAVGSLYAPLTVLFGRGDGTFGSPKVIGPADWDRDVAIADLNNDGNMDLVSTNHMWSAVIISYGHGDGSFESPVSYRILNRDYFGTPLESKPSGLVLRDFNGDGLPDIAVSLLTAFWGSNDGGVRVLLNNGDGTFTNREDRDYRVGLSPYSMTVGDFDGDGKADLATANTYGDTVTVMYGKEDGGFENLRSYPTNRFPRFVAAADINKDGYSDLAMTDEINQGVSVLLGRQDRSFGPLENYTANVRPIALAFEDVNEDGSPDLAVANNNGPQQINSPPNPSFVSVLLNTAQPVLSDFALSRAATADSASVLVDYSVSLADITSDLPVAFYRSTTADLSGDVYPIGATKIPATALARGSYKDVRLVLDDSTPGKTFVKDLTHPYVVVVANQPISVKESNYTNDIASFAFSYDSRLKDAPLIEGGTVTPIRGSLGSFSEEFYILHLPQRSNFSVLLSGMSDSLGNADVKLLGSDGQQLDISAHDAKSAETMNRIYEKGYYIIQVYNLSAQPVDYTLAVLSRPYTPSPQIAGVVSRSGGNSPFPVALRRIGGQAIQVPESGEQGITTWIVIHGRNDNPDPNPDDQSGTIAALASTIDSYPQPTQSHQVLVVDWNAEAGDNIDFGPVPGLQGASWIASVGTWAAHMLQDLGIPEQDVNLVGHSWGSYVSYEIANTMGKVNSIVALDPAMDGPIVNDYPTALVNFSAYAKLSLALVSSWAGNYLTATTADEAFGASVPGSTVRESHRNVVNLFRSMLIEARSSRLAPVSGHFDLGRIAAGLGDVWDKDGVSAFPLFPVLGYEGYIVGALSGTEWHPVSLQYSVGGIGIREAVVPDETGSYLMRDYVGNSSLTANDLRTAKSGILRSWTGASNPADVYVLRLKSPMSTLYIKTDASTPGLSVELYDFGTLGEKLTSATLSSGSKAKLNLVAGVYYLEVSTGNGYHDSPYKVTFSVIAGVRSMSAVVNQTGAYEPDSIISVISRTSKEQATRMRREVGSTLRKGVAVLPTFFRTAHRLKNSMRAPIKVPMRK